MKHKQEDKELHGKGTTFTPQHKPSSTKDTSKEKNHQPPTEKVIPHLTQPRKKNTN